jgi:hypothetical protein
MRTPEDNREVVNELIDRLDEARPLVQRASEKQVHR